MLFCLSILVSLKLGNCNQQLQS